MKLTLFLLLIFTGFAFADNANSQNARVNLNKQNSMLKDVLEEIESQTDYLFVSNREINLEQHVSVRAKNLPVREVLDKIFENMDLSYSMEGVNIILSQKVSVDNSLSVAVIQQKRTITGTVVDKSGEPVIGANVVEKGTTNGIITDIDGRFIINVENNATLKVSYIGYLAQEITPGNQSQLNIVLLEDLQALDEVIVIGYGTARRQDYTGSVSSVKLENSAMSVLPNLNVLETLKGSVAGVNIGATGSSGEDPSMLIRGQNSINGSNDPLIVLDGVIFMGKISDINPNDIASIDVLKDAVSSAVYGSRAANGIIAISTKKGHSEKPVITLNTSLGFHVWQDQPKMMKGEQWLRQVNDVAGNTPGSTSVLTAKELDNYNNGSEVRWLDEVSRTGTVQEYQLAVSGSAKGLNYYLSTSYNDYKGIIKGDDYNRISILAKINADITSWLNIGVDASFSRRDYPEFNAHMTTAQTSGPYSVMYRDHEGNLERWPRELGTENPLWGVYDGTTEKMDIRKNFRLNTYVVVSLPFVKGLSYRFNFLPNLDQNRQGAFYYENYYITEGAGDDRYTPAAIQSLLSKANGYLLNSQTYSYVIDNIINYKNLFGAHSVEATLVATRDYSKYNLVRTTGSDFSGNGNTTLGMWGLHKATVQKTDLYGTSAPYGGTIRTNIGYLGRASYSYNGKYYLTGSIRRDGASIFGANNKWGTFAAVGVAWRITEEKFMERVKHLDNLKLKFSWGQNGNQGIDPYVTLSQVSNGSTGGIRYQFSNTGEKIYYGLVQTSLGNQDLGWESTDAYNIGIESAWLKNRLFADVDFYVSKTYDQIFKRTIPIMTGFGAITTSMGQVDNTGIEVTLRSFNISRPDFSWMTTLTFWKNKNKLVKLYGEDLNGDGKEDDDIANSLFIGKSLGAIYGYKQIGIVQEDDVEYMELTGATPGTPKYVDLDGVPGISGDDRTILGYGKENFRLSMGNTLQYKNFELYMLVSGVFGGNNHYLKSNPRAFLASGTGMYKDNMQYKPYWTSENPSNVYPSAQFAGDGRFLGLQSRAFVRIQDLSLSYTFDTPWVKSANINMLKVFLAAKNLATFTDWVGFDPETGTGFRDGASKLPLASSYSLGLNISF